VGAGRTARRVEIIRGCAGERPYHPELPHETEFPKRLFRSRGVPCHKREPGSQKAKPCPKLLMPLKGPVLPFKAVTRGDAVIDHLRISQRFGHHEQAVLEEGRIIDALRRLHDLP